MNNAEINSKRKEKESNSINFNHITNDNLDNLIQEAINNEQWSSVISLTRDISKYKKINLLALIYMERFKQALKQHKGSTTYDYAYCLYKEGKYLKCIKILNILEKSPQINILSAQCFYHLCQYREAANLYKLLLLNNDDRFHVNYLACLSQLNYNNENNIMTREERDMINLLKSDNYEILFNQSLCKMNMGKDATDEIIKAIEIIDSLKNANNSLQMELATTNACLALNYQLLKRFEDADRVYQTFLSKHDIENQSSSIPTSSSTFYIIKNISIFNRSLMHKPVDFEALFNLFHQSPPPLTHHPKENIQKMQNAKCKRIKKLSPLQNKIIQFNLKFKK